MVMDFNRKHPLQMTEQELSDRHAVIVEQMDAIEKLLKLRIDDPASPDVYPDLENDWGQLDTERNQILAEQEKIRLGTRPAIQ